MRRPADDLGDLPALDQALDAGEGTTITLTLRERHWVARGKAKIPTAQWGQGVTILDALIQLGRRRGLVLPKTPHERLCPTAARQDGRSK